MQYVEESAFKSVGDAELPSPASVLGALSSLRRGEDLAPTSAGLCVSGEDADRIHVARLATHVRGLDLAFPRAGTSVTRPAILSVLASVPSISPLCGSATGAVNPTTRRAPRAHELTLEGASCGARRHREPPDDQGDNTPVDGKTWSHP